MNASTENALVNRDGIRIEIGQRWRNCDKRLRDQVKEVVAIDLAKKKVQLATLDGSYKSWNTIFRMYKHPTGWEHVQPLELHAHDR